jgi:hypothetical protein
MYVIRSIILNGLRLTNQEITVFQLHDFHKFVSLMEIRFLLSSFFRGYERNVSIYLS